MAWSENSYVETRFGGIDMTSERHALDRDSGTLPDIFNMETRTGGLRTRPGWILFGAYPLIDGAPPGVPKVPTALIPYEPNISLDVNVGGDDVPAEDDTGTGVWFPSVEVDGGGSSNNRKPDMQEEKEDVEESDAAYFSFSVIGETVVAYVPFAVSIARNGVKQGVYQGAGARLSAALMSGNIPVAYSASPAFKASAWSGNRWLSNVRVDAHNRSKSTLRLTVKTSAADSASCDLPYGVGSMYPYLPSLVSHGDEFTYSVQYEYRGKVCADYAGGGRSMSVLWFFRDDNNQTVPGSVEVLSSSWSNGVLTGKARIASAGTTAVALVLRCTFAGEEIDAEAGIHNPLDVSIDGPSSIHVYGETALLKITASRKEF